MRTRPIVMLAYLDCFIAFIVCVCLWNKYTVAVRFHTFVSSIRSVIRFFVDFAIGSCDCLIWLYPERPSAQILKENKKSWRKSRYYRYEYEWFWKQSLIIVPSIVSLIAEDANKQHKPTEYINGNGYVRNNTVYTNKNNANNSMATSTVASATTSTSKSPRKQQKHRINGGGNKRDTWTLTSTVAADRAEFSSNEDLATCEKGMWFFNFFPIFALINIRLIDNK